MKTFFLFIALFAWSFTSHANVLGDMQTFAPSTDGQDFITVHSARPLKKGFWAFSGYFNYAKNYLLVYDNMATQEMQSYKDELTEFDLDVAYGISDNLQLFLAAPILMSQHTDGDMNPKISVTKGVHSWRPGFKWTFSQEEEKYWAFILSSDILNVIDNPYTGNDAAPIINAEIAGTWRTGKVAKSLNVGYRVRKPGDQPTNARMFPLHDQLIFSGGLSGAFSKTARWVTEAIFSYPIHKGDYLDAMDAASADLLFGMKHRWVTNLNFDWGFTVEPGAKTLAPDWRVFTGLVYYWGPKPSPKSEPVKNAPILPVEDVPLQRDEDFISMDDGGALTPAPSELKLSPQFAEVYEGSRLVFKTSGGTEPYRYRIVEGRGRIDNEGIFRAPTRPGKTIVDVTDDLGQKREATIIVKAPPKADRVIRLGNMKFKFNSSKELAGSSDKELEEAIRTMRGLNVKRIIVEGHTDSIGNNDYNQDLSERRAETIRQIFIRRLGLPPSAVDAVGYGEDRPVATNATAAGRQRNRRVDLRVYFK